MLAKPDPPRRPCILVYYQVSLRLAPPDAVIHHLVTSSLTKSVTNSVRKRLSICKAHNPFALGLDRDRGHVVSAASALSFLTTPHNYQNYSSLPYVVSNPSEDSFLMYTGTLPRAGTLVHVGHHAHAVVWQHTLLFEAVPARLLDRATFLSPSHGRASWEVTSTAQAGFGSNEQLASLLTTRARPVCTLRPNRERVGADICL